MSRAPRPKNPYIGLAVLMLAVLLISIDATVLSFALPALSADLDPTGVELLWIVDSYGFAIAGLLLTMGTLGDHIGRRRVLLVGAALFGAASATAAFSTSVPQLIAARVLLGIGGAALMPPTLSLIRTLFPNSQKRARAIAVWAATFSVGAATGPIIGGALLEHFHWGAVFLINLPVVALLLVGGRLLLPESRNPNPGRFDIPGGVLSVTAIVPGVYAIKSVAEVGGFTLQAAAALAFSVVATTTFIWRLKTAKDPLLDINLFSNRDFSAIVVVNGLSMFILIGLLFVLSQFLQGAAGLSPLEAGLLLLPGLVASALASLAAGHLVGRFHPGRVVAFGMALAGVGSLLFAFAGADKPWLVGAAFAVLEIGLGIVDPVTTDAIVGSVAPEKSGAASSISEVGYELGGAFGTAVLGSVLVAIYAGNLTRWLADSKAPAGVDATPATHTIGAARDLAEQVGGSFGNQLLAVAQDSFVAAASVTGILAAVVSFGAAALALTVRRRPAVIAEKVRVG